MRNKGTHAGRLRAMLTDSELLPAAVRRLSFRSLRHGEHIVFTSSRMGFKDEVTYTDAPQPYGELFVMRYDGSDVQQLTDNQWEDGTPAWRPMPGARLQTARH